MNIKMHLYHSSDLENLRVLGTLYQKVKVKSLSCVRLFCDPMDFSPAGSSAHGFSRQEYWSGLPFHSPGDLPDSGIEPRSLALQAGSLPSEPSGITLNY